MFAALRLEAARVAVIDQVLRFSSATAQNRNRRDRRRRRLGRRIPCISRAGTDAHPIAAVARGDDIRFINEFHDRLSLKRRRNAPQRVCGLNAWRSNSRHHTAVTLTTLRLNIAP